MYLNLAIAFRLEFFDNTAKLVYTVPGYYNAKKTMAYSPRLTKGN